MLSRRLRSKMNKSLILTKKYDLRYDADECEFCLNDILSINEDKSLNDDEFFEIINKKARG